MSNSEKNIKYENWYKIDITFRKFLNYGQYAKVHLYIFTSKSDKCYFKKLIVFTIGSRNIRYLTMTLIKVYKVSTQEDNKIMLKVIEKF